MDLEQDFILRQEVFSKVSRLNARRQEVLIMRFGLDGKGWMTLEEIAQHLKLTRERVRQIEASALRQLRHPCFGNSLKSFIGEEGKELRIRTKLEWLYQGKSVEAA